MSDDHLKTLDKELAPYPFDGLPQWKALINQINANLLEKIIPGHQVDGISTVIGEEAERGESGLNADTKREGEGMRFTQFRLKRSWKDGAIGQEVTRYSQDKSWLFGHVVRTEHGGGELVNSTNRDKANYRPVRTAGTAATCLYPPSPPVFI